MAKRRDRKAYSRGKEGKEKCMKMKKMMREVMRKVKNRVDPICCDEGASGSTSAVDDSLVVRGVYEVFKLGLELEDIDLIRL